MEAGPDKQAARRERTKVDGVNDERDRLANGVTRHHAALGELSMAENLSETELA